MSKDSHAPTEVTPPATETNETNTDENSPAPESAPEDDSNN